jgi:predicted transcriptional regulator
MSHITIELSETLMALLQAEAEKQQISVNTLIQDAIMEYLYGEEPEYEDTPDEEILAGLREALEQLKRGEYRPAREAMAEIRRELEEERKVHAD